MTVRVHIVVGNPRAGSRTRAAAEALVSAIMGTAAHSVTVVELSEYADELFAWGSARVKELVAEVGSTELLVVATPTYKASYTGLLKAFLDRYGAGELAGITAIPLHTGGDLRHSLSPAHTLVPLLQELGASVPAGGLYLVADEVSEDSIGAATEHFLRSVRAVAALGSAIDAG